VTPLACRIRLFEHSRTRLPAPGIQPHAQRRLSDGQDRRAAPTHLLFEPSRRIPRRQPLEDLEGHIIWRAYLHIIWRTTSCEGPIAILWLTLTSVISRSHPICIRDFQVRCFRAPYHYWERTGSVCIIHLCSVFVKPPPFSSRIYFLRISLLFFERVCCLLVLNSVTSTPQCIRQPKAAWVCVWCLCLRVSMCSDILRCLYLRIRAICLEGSYLLLFPFLRILSLNFSPLAVATKMAQLIFRDQNYLSSAIHFVCVYTLCLHTRYTKYLMWRSAIMAIP
jgi:hypothetical protein